MTTTIEVETTAEAYLRLLHARGVDYFIGNAGTDFAPIVEAMARMQARGLPGPKPVTVPHENAAAAMAHGYYVVTGRPQVLMVHVSVGTANAICATINAARDNIPLILTAGRTPLTEIAPGGPAGARSRNIHWPQETYDQGGMLREFVKWDYELRNPQQLESVVDRALEVAMTEPRGPVYLTLPREVIGAPLTSFAYADPARRGPARAPGPDPDAIAELAAHIAAAKKPLLITSNIGIDTAAAQALASLAETYALPVVSFRPRYVCLPTNHPMHMGYEPSPLIREADLVVAIDSDVPWILGQEDPPAKAKVAHIGVAPLYPGIPIRSFPSDLAITSHSRLALDALARALAPHAQAMAGAIETRRRGLADIRASRAEAARAQLDKGRNARPISAAWITHCIDQARDPEGILINEYPMVWDQMRIERPGSFFNTAAAAGLGWGMGAALGAKLAAPEREVIAMLGDGAYMFGNPTPVHYVAQAEGLPILFIVFNNSMWGAVRRATLGMYPKGHAAKSNREPLTLLEPPPAFEKVAEASGAYGARVDDPAQVPHAIRTALDVVRTEKRQALLNIACEGV